jgi:hypothetical protein
MKVFDKIMKYLRSLDLKGWLILIVLIVVFFAFVWPKIKGTVKKAIANITGGKVDDGTKNNPISDVRKGEIKGKATVLYNGIHWTWLIVDEAAVLDGLNFFLALPDNEAIYFAQQYEDLGDNSMWYDVDWLYLWGDEDNKAVARLETLGFDYQ